MQISPSFGKCVSINYTSYKKNDLPSALHYTLRTLISLIFFCPKTKYSIGVDLEEALISSYKKDIYGSS